MRAPDLSGKSLISAGKIGVGISVKAGGGRSGNPQNNRFAPRRSQRVLVADPLECSTVSISQDQTSRRRYNVGGERRTDREINRIGVRAVMLPLQVGAEVAEARLDFDDHDPPVGRDRCDINATTVGQRELRHTDHPVGA